MGGSIAIIKKHRDIVKSHEGYTNSFSSVVNNLNFYQDPNNEPLNDYLQVFTELNGVFPIDYGLYVIDYDNKNIYTINGYSSYMGIMPTGISLEENDFQNKRPFTSKYHEFYDKGFVCIKTTRAIGTGYPDIRNEVSYKNVNDMDEDFNNLYDVGDWLDGKSNTLNPFKKKVKRNKFIEVNDNLTIINDIYVDFKKLGWNYYSFEESIYGYVELYKQMISDGWEFSKEELTEWDEFVSPDEEDDNERGFLEIIKKEIRKEKLKDLGII